MGAREVLQAIHGWMARLKRAIMANQLMVGVLGGVALFLAVSLLILLLEAVGHFSGAVRAVLLAVWVISALAAVLTGFLWPLLRYTVLAPDDKKLARRYASRMPTVRDRVLNALQLLERAEGANREGYSPDLILEAGREVAQDLQTVDPRALPNRKPVRLTLRVALGVGALSVVSMLVGGSSLLSAAGRVMKPGQEFEPPAPFALTIKPGDVRLVRGDSLTVEVTAAGQAPSSVIVERLEKGKTATEPALIRGENGIYRYTYRGITTPFTYWARQGRVKSESYTVEVQELPGVRFLSVRLTPPAYTSMPEQVLEENVGDIAAVVGTRATLKLSATKPLHEARIEFLKPEHAGTDSEIVHAAKALHLEGSRASVEFMIDESGYYRLRLTDTEGLAGRDPILYRVTARPDEPPLVSLVEPAHDLDIAAGVTVGVAAEAVDDFGFTRMNLRYHRTSAMEPSEMQSDETRYETVPLNLKLLAPGKGRAEYLWDLTPLDLLPEDQVLCFVEVWDNDAIHGPKRARSETRTLRFPSMGEIFDRQQQEAESREITLSDLLKESAAIREKVEEAVQEFRSNPEMSWERKKELEQLMDKQRAMNEMLNKISEAMQQAAQEMEQRSMFSPDVMDKLRQIQQLVKEVITPEMRKALEQLAAAMQQPTEEQIRQALENFQNNQQMFEQALDQTLNMLKQLKIAKKLDELTRRLDELGRRQDQLNEAMDKNTPQTAAKNAQEQKKLSEEMRKIEQETRKLSEQMQKESTPGSQQMQQLQKEMEQEQLSEQMQENSNSMSMCQNQSAKKKGRHVRRRMADMANAMQNIRSQMETDQMAEVLEKLERTRDQILDLSVRQEKLWKDSENLTSGSPQLAQTAEEQENLRQAMSRINEDLLDLARQTLFVNPQMMAAVHQTLQQMRAASTAAQERDPRTAAHYRRQALGALNNALRETNQACSSCKNACNKGNPNSMCNKAGQMAGAQRNLNQQTQDLMSQCQNPGSLSMGEQAAMQKLAVEQRTLAKSARELAQEAQASQQSLGRLEDVAREMEDVAKDLSDRNATQRTLQQQEHIESRLLDFQRATREREFSPRRRATPGVDIVRATPRPLPDKPGQDQLREDLLRALDAKYSPDYEQLIRAYFDALSKWK
jgi:hypothetical protein